MPTLHFYGGHYEIGGTKLLLRTAEGAVFLEFGKSYGVEGRYFEEPWNRPYHIPSLLSVGALPDIPGLYRTDAASPPVNGIIVSHAHTDHHGYVPLIAPHIPVYIGADTKNLTDIRLETARDDWSTQDDHVEWRTFRTGEEVAIEGTDVRFHPVHVDHSVPASYGFILEAGGKRIGYTGDIRLHGRHSYMTDEFVRALGQKPLDVLICEGTRVFPAGGDPDDELRRSMENFYRDRMGEQAPQAVRLDCQTEEDVEREMTRLIGQSDRLVLVEVSPIDLDRMFTVHRAARACGRTLVLPARQAYIMREAADRTLIRDLVPIEETALFLSQRKRDKRELQPDEPEDTETYKKGRAKDWEQPIIEAWENAGSPVLWGLDGRAELRQHGSRYVVCAPAVVYILPELCYRAGPCPIDFILSKSEPFTEEMVFSFDKLLQWLALYGCDRYYQVHVSGHASPEELRRIVDLANPSVLVPVHTRHPALFRDWHDGVIVPAREPGAPVVL